MSNDSYGFLAGGGPTSGKFKAHGDTVGGPIVGDPVEQQQRDLETQKPLTWDDGKPRMQLVVTVQTQERDPAIEDDDGLRRLFIKGEMKKAVQAAVIAAGARGLDEGGELYVTYTGDGEKKGFLTPPKLYSARYVKPSAAAAPAPAPQSAPAAPAAAANGLPADLSDEARAALRQLGHSV